MACIVAADAAAELVTDTVFVLSREFVARLNLSLSHQTSFWHSLKSCPTNCSNKRIAKEAMG
ncbi:MAG: hypothetical protein ACK4I8_01390 [Armatimonadota bacterium]